MKTLALAVLVALTSGCHIYASVERVERSFPPSVITAGTAGVSVSISRDLPLELGANGLPKLLTTLEVSRLHLTPRTGVTKLDFISNITLSILGDGALPTQVLARYDRSTPLAADGSIDVLGLDVDLVPYVLKDLPLRLEGDFAAPAVDWSLGIAIELDATSDGKIQL